MESIAPEEKKLEELIEKAVRKHLKVDLQDMDEVRRSPAASIIRIENRLDAIESRMSRDMVTRGEFHEAFGQSNSRLSRLEATVEALQTSMVTRAEFKDEIWKLKLYIILLAVLIVLTNPTVLELFGKLLGLVK